MYKKRITTMNKISNVKRKSFSNIMNFLRILSAIPWCLRFDNDDTGIISRIMKTIYSLTNEVDEDAIVMMLKNNPMLLSRLQSEIMNVISEVETGYVQDRCDARKRDIIIREKYNDTNKRANMMILFSAVGFIGCLILIGYMTEDTASEFTCALSTMCGIFGACLRDAYVFEFGGRRQNNNEYDQ